MATFIKREDVKAMQDAQALITNITKDITALVTLWRDGDFVNTMDAICNPKYPHSLPSLDEFMLELAEWQADVEERVEFTMQNISPAFQMYDDELAQDVNDNFFQYSALGYNIEHDAHNDMWGLDIISTSISELEGSKDGVLKSYTYNSEEEVLHDLELLQSSTTCQFDEI